MIKQYYFTGIGNSFDGYSLFIEDQGELSLKGVVQCNYSRNNNTSNIISPTGYYGQRIDDLFAIGPSSTLSGYLSYRNTLTGIIDPNVTKSTYHDNTGIYNQDEGAFFRYELLFPPTFTIQNTTYYFTTKSYNRSTPLYQDLVTYDLISSDLSYSKSYNVDEILVQYGADLSSAISADVGILSGWVPHYRNGTDYECTLMTPITNFEMLGNESYYLTTFNYRHGNSIDYKPLTGFIELNSYSNASFGTENKVKDVYMLNNDKVFLPVTSGINEYEEDLSAFTFSLPIMTLSSKFGPDPSSLISHEYLTSFDGDNWFPFKSSSLQSNTSLFNDAEFISFTNTFGRHYVEVTELSTYLHISNHCYINNSMPYFWGDWSGPDITTLNYHKHFFNNLSGNTILINTYNNTTSAPTMLNVPDVDYRQVYNFSLHYACANKFEKENELEVYLSIDPQSYVVAI